MRGSSPEETWHFGVLGPLRVRHGDAEVDLGSPKQRAVLGLLLLAAPQPAPVEVLVEEIWGDSGPSDPTRSLQVYVSALRRALGCPESIRSEAGGYRIDLRRGRLDATIFEESAAQAADLLVARDPRAAADRATAALAQWRGEPWQDLRDVARLAADAARLDRLRLDTEIVAARAALDCGRHRQVVSLLEGAAQRHPFDETVRELLMLALHRSGHRVRALEVYAQGRRRLREETGLEPGARLRDLHAAVLADDPALAVEDAELRSRRHLPAPVTSLVGRDRELSTLAAALRAHRLVTLTGPGGVGKTRLAAAAAYRAAVDFPDGVWFVALDAVTDPATVAQAIADAVGLEAPEEIVSALHAWAGERRALLVLDNLEHLLDTAPLLGSLLAAAPELRTLATSRVRLQVYGEHVVALEPLPGPDAVRLFADRAASVAPWFDPGTGEEVSRLCDALDRLPLALELVAARADRFGLAQMLDQLGERLGLAADGPRDRSGRQRSVREAVAWSVRLLEPGPAHAFARLGVFSGGFTQEAAARIVDPTVLPDLVRASLLVEERGRWRMLETIRAYALELAAEELPELREAHAAWCLDLAAAGSIGLNVDRRRWLDTLRVETPNLRAALAHLAEVAESDSPTGTRLLRLAVDLGTFWYRTSPGSEDVEWLSRAVDAAPQASALLRARARYAQAICRAEQGSCEPALELCHQALALLPVGEADSWRARVLNSIAGLTRDLGRSHEALSLMKESVALRRALADPALGLLVPLGNLSMGALDVGDTRLAREALTEAVAVAGEDDLELAICQAHLANVEIAEGDADAAATLLATAIPVLRKEGERYRLVECLDSLAALAVLRGGAEEAAVLVAAADRALSEDGARLVPADQRLRELRVGPAVAALHDDVRDAARAQGAALDLGAALDRGIAVIAPGAGD